MKPYHETVASGARYGRCAGVAFRDPLILWEKSEDDYQGSCELLGFNGAALFHYQWSYGSCSGCDSWEAEGLTDEQVALTMRGGAVYFDNITEFGNYLDMRFGEQNKDNYWGTYLSEDEKDKLCHEGNELLDGAL